MTDTVFEKVPADERPQYLRRAADKMSANGQSLTARIILICADTIEDQAARLAAQDAALAEAREVVSDLTPPEHGAHGGPLVGAEAYYEDGDKAGISKASFARARAWLEKYGQQENRK